MSDTYCYKIEICIIVLIGVKDHFNCHLFFLYAMITQDFLETHTGCDISF